MGAILLEVAGEFGLPPQQVLQGTAIDEAALSVPETRISIRDQNRMLAYCLAASGEPSFALHFGSRIPVVALGVLGYALMCCRNVQELMDVLGRYQRLLGGGFRIAVETGPDAVSIRLLGGMLESVAQRADCEVFFAAAAGSLRQLGVNTHDSMQVELAYPDPGYAELYRHLVCPRLRFGGAQNRLSLDRQLLEVPLQFANPTLLRLYRQQCEHLLASLSRSAEYTDEVRGVLLERPGRFPTIEESAERLHLSPRTLRRRLEEEGSTYQRIVHELRRELAQTHLRDGVLSIAEIADMLGYADLSNFRRAFISWTGQSPAAYRRRIRERGPPPVGTA